MKIVGVICEYNPFHNGHKKQIDMIRAEFGDDCAIVCLMSGNFVQRGDFAIQEKDEPIWKTVGVDRESIVTAVMN